MKRLLLFVLVGLMFTTIISHTSAQNKENLEVILIFPEGHIGWSSVNSKDDSLLVTEATTGEECYIYWLKIKK